MVRGNPHCMFDVGVAAQIPATRSRKLSVNGGATPPSSSAPIRLYTSRPATNEFSMTRSPVEIAPLTMRRLGERCKSTSRATLAPTRRFAMGFDALTIGGFVGAAIVVVAYFANQQGWLESSDWRFPAANL